MQIDLTRPVSEQWPPPCGWCPEKAVCAFSTSLSHGRESYACREHSPFRHPEAYEGQGLRYADLDPMTLVPSGTFASPGMITVMSGPQR